MNIVPERGGGREGRGSGAVLCHSQVGMLRGAWDILKQLGQEEKLWALGYASGREKAGGLQGRRRRGTRLGRRGEDMQSALLPHGRIVERPDAYIAPRVIGRLCGAATACLPHLHTACHTTVRAMYPIPHLAAPLVLPCLCGPPPPRPPSTGCHHCILPAFSPPLHHLLVRLYSAHSALLPIPVPSGLGWAGNLSFHDL